MAAAGDCPLRVIRGWNIHPGLLGALKSCFTYGAGEDRATGYLYAEGEQGWPGPLAKLGPMVLAAAAADLGERFSHVAFQAYRDGSGTPWHADAPFAAQAVLSLGVTRSFQVRRAGGAGGWEGRLRDGDLVFMPPGFQEEWEHRVPVEDVPGERCSVVLRTVAR